MSMSKIIHPMTDIETVAEETSSREANAMLRAGWRLLLVLAAHDGAGSYPVYVLGRPRSHQHHPDAGPVEA